MGEPDITIIPPPPPPPVITLDSGDEKEDGELSDETRKKEAKVNNNQKSPKKSKKPPSHKERNDSEIEIVGDDLYVLDDGADISFDPEADGGFEALQLAFGIQESSFDLTLNITETPKITRRSGTCFNCDGAHTLAECNLPHDRKRINKNRQSFGSNRKERIMDKTTKSTPGRLSDKARDALNLMDEYPLWIYRMREEGPFRGYPPGYLKRLVPNEKTLSFFTEDPVLSEAFVKEEVKFDPDKIVWYEGFNSIDRTHPAERALNKGLRRDHCYPTYTKEQYAEELKKYVEDLQSKELRSNEQNRKRRHEHDNTAANKSKKAQKRADAKKRQRERKRWEQIKEEENEKKLLSDFRNTDFDKEPEKLFMVDETFGIFASKTERKRIDRSNNRRSESLELEANWSKRMDEEEELRQEAETLRKDLERDDRAARKLAEQPLADKQAQKKAEREAKDKARLKIQRKLVDACTQTRPVLITELPEELPLDESNKEVIVTSDSSSIVNLEESLKEFLPVLHEDETILDAPPVIAEEEEEVLMNEISPLKKNTDQSRNNHQNQPSRKEAGRSNGQAIPSSSNETKNQRPVRNRKNRNKRGGQKNDPIPLNEINYGYGGGYGIPFDQHQIRVPFVKIEYNKKLPASNSRQTQKSAPKNKGQPNGQAFASSSNENRNQRQGRNRNNRRKKDPKPEGGEEEYHDYMTEFQARALAKMKLDDNKPQVSMPTNDRKFAPAEAKGKMDAPIDTLNIIEARVETPKQSSEMDSPASPEVPPVVSRVMTEDQAIPKPFLVPFVDDRHMPDQKNFSVGITPFQINEVSTPTGRLDNIEKLMKTIRKN